jgi:hypothetical protein
MRKYTTVITRCELENGNVCAKLCEMHNFGINAILRCDQIKFATCRANGKTMNCTSFYILCLKFIVTVKFDSTHNKMEYEQETGNKPSN